MDYYRSDAHKGTKVVKVKFVDGCRTIMSAGVDGFAYFWDRDNYMNTSSTANLTFVSAADVYTNFTKK